MLEIVFMKKKHIRQVAEIEKQCFITPWSIKSFEQELKNKFAIYIVCLNDGKVVGYGGMWHVINEGHITNVAVSEEYRNKGIAISIMNKLTDIACEKEMIGLTLEVRKSNNKAIELYKKLGFKIEGIRKEYYSDTKEDAFIMWKYLIPENEIIN